MIKLAPSEMAALDPYTFMAVIGKRVIHPGGRASTASLPRRSTVTASSLVLTSVPCLGYIVVAGTTAA